MDSNESIWDSMSAISELLLMFDNGYWSTYPESSLV